MLCLLWVRSIHATPVMAIFGRLWAVPVINALCRGGVYAALPTHIVWRLKTTGMKIFCKCAGLPFELFEIRE
ncbi:MAG: hypothetical protein DYG98_06630 [Haliscomenobacteraceae bacterium CHB4]|nr:hypothetical protein [Haliscomenobacteraceae bacterium CHB4]